MLMRGGSDGRGLSAVAAVVARFSRLERGMGFACLGFWFYLSLDV